VYGCLKVSSGDGNEGLAFKMRKPIQTETSVDSSREHYLSRIICTFFYSSPLFCLNAKSIRLLICLNAMHKTFLHFIAETGINVKHPQET